MKTLTTKDGKTVFLVNNEEEERKEFAIRMARLKGVRVEDSNIFRTPPDKCSFCGSETSTTEKKINLIAAKRTAMFPVFGSISYRAAQRRGIVILHLCDKCIESEIDIKTIPIIKHLRKIGWMIGSSLSRYDIIHADDMWPDEKERVLAQHEKLISDLKPTGYKDLILPACALITIIGVVIYIIYAFHAEEQRHDEQRQTLQEIINLRENGKGFW